MDLLAWTTLHTFDTEFSADSIEWCPHDPYKDLFVCGTYQLLNNSDQNEGPQKRIGQMLLFSLSDTRDKLDCLQKIDTDAILDLKWCHTKLNNEIILAAATANGDINMYKLVQDDNIRLHFFTTIKVNNELLCLSLDWNTKRNTSDCPSLIISDSLGSISVFNFSNNELNLSTSWKAHDFEAWICAFNYWNTNIVYSGGDDCKLKIFDLRQNASTVFTSKKHSAGVTSIQHSCKSENVLATGSYDENVFLWDIRNMKTTLSCLKTSGGVWRIKWDPFEENNILVACMYGTFQLLDARDHTNLKLVADYDKHKSIAYGADWCYKNENNSKCVATCSFYDHLLHVSEIDL